MLDKTLLYYIASPYTAKGHTGEGAKEIEHARYVEVTRIAAELTEKEDIAILCPITTSHMLKVYNDNLGTSWKEWKKIDYILLKHVDALLVCLMPGWDKSTGVNGEIQIAKNLKIPIYYVDPETLEVRTESHAVH